MSKDYKQRLDELVKLRDELNSITVYSTRDKAITLAEELHAEVERLKISKIDSDVRSVEITNDYVKQLWQLRTAADKMKEALEEAVWRSDDGEQGYIMHPLNNYQAKEALATYEQARGE